ncbi:hypothetical protein H0H81_008672 [Sphagnurus paluster]|uniref:Transmembrane protein n=1 Tax=Sphagnurus paluster TaxID=117069 RepID=A0A9P7FPT4_9AGAR|nr:hypothetical protein H0H81_008672 [Sphagnurus paluster]
MANIFIDETSDRLALRASGEPHLSDTLFVGGTAQPLAGGSVSLFFQGECLATSTQPRLVGMYSPPRTSDQGTSATFFGAIFPFDLNFVSVDLEVLVDDEAPVNMIVPALSSVGPIYTTPTLKDGTHNITFSTRSSFLIDYVVVMAGVDTPLNSQTLIVDDADTALRYAGTWTIGPKALIGTNSSRLAFGNATHQTTEVNATAKFSFIGNALSLYGPSNPGPGAVGLKFILDGEASPLTLFTPQSVSNTNFRWYQKDCAPGNHTLEVQVAQNPGSGVFSLDYILYTPTFEYLSGQTVGAAGATKTASLAEPSRTAAPSVPPQAASRSSRQGVIIGAVVGGAFGVALLIGFLVLGCRKRVRKSSSSEKRVDNPFKSVLPPYTEGTGGSTRLAAEGFVYHKPTISNQAVYIQSTFGDQGPAPSRSSAPNLAEKQDSVNHKPSTQTQFRAINSSTMDIDVRAATSNPRVHELVAELQRELGGTQGQGLALRGLVVHREGEDLSHMESSTTWDSGRALASSIPPPYEPRR